jgi:hypothetical protein
MALASLSVFMILGGAVKQNAAAPDGCDGV